MTLRERFDEKWIPEPNSGCWLWTAAVNPYGYGRIMVSRKNSFAHRISWEIHNGRIPFNIRVLHKCDVPSCVNPEHLFLGTDRDNLIDSILKNRRKYLIGSGMNWTTVRSSHPPKRKCKHGHDLTPENIYITPQGLNACKTCRRSNVRRWRGGLVTSATTRS